MEARPSSWVATLDSVSAVAETGLLQPASRVKSRNPMNLGAWRNMGTPVVGCECEPGSPAVSKGAAHR